MRVPELLLTQFEMELDGLKFGSASLTIFFHDGIPRFEISRKVSIIPGKPSSGAQFPQGGSHDA